MLLMKCWITPPLLHFFLRVANSRFYCFALSCYCSFLREYDYMFCVLRQQRGCFVWLGGWQLSKYPTPCFAPINPTEKWQSVGLCSDCQLLCLCWLPSKHQFHHILCHSVLINERFQLHPSFGWRGAGSLAGLVLPLHQTCSPVRSLCFILYVCGRRKKVKSSHSGIHVAWVWHRSYWPSMLFSLIYFQLSLLCLFMFFIALLFSFPLFPLYCLFFSLRLFLYLFVSFSFALWDLVPACLTSLTMKQMLILIILLAAISLWSSLMLKEQPLHSVVGGAKYDLVTAQELLHFRLLCMFLMPYILHAVKHELHFHSADGIRKFLLWMSMPPSPRDLLMRMQVCVITSMTCFPEIRDCPLGFCIKM